MNQAYDIAPKPVRRSRIKRSRAQWRSLIEKLSVSDLTHQAFCRQHKITSSSLYKWRKVFADRSESSPFIEITDKLLSTDIKDEAIDKGSSGWQVELSLGRSIVLRINPDKG